MTGTALDKFVEWIGWALKYQYFDSVDEAVRHVYESPPCQPEDDMWVGSTQDLRYLAYCKEQDRLAGKYWTLQDAMDDPDRPVEAYVDENLDPRVQDRSEAKGRRILDAEARGMKTSAAHQVSEMRIHEQQGA